MNEHTHISIPYILVLSYKLIKIKLKHPSLTLLAQRVSGMCLNQRNIKLLGRRICHQFFRSLMIGFFIFHHSILSLAPMQGGIK
jgi:hypothetical protein